MRSVSAQQKLRPPRGQDATTTRSGALIDGFNAMLAEIQQRDTALQGVNDNLTARTRELEREVTERLRAQEELKTLNATLEAARRRAQRGRRAACRMQLARSEEAQQNQTRILQSILDSMSDGVIVADDNGRLILVNPAAETMLRPGWRSPRLHDQWAHALRLLPARHRHALPHGTVPADAGRERRSRRGRRGLRAAARDTRTAVAECQRHAAQGRGWRAAQRRRHLPRHHRPEACGGRTAEREGRGRGRQPRQEPVPGQHEPRAAHAAERHHRLQRDAAGRGRGPGPARARSRTCGKIHAAGKHLLR